jgi:hypothetical protein
MIIQSSLSFANKAPNLELASADRWNVICLDPHFAELEVQEAMQHAIDEYDNFYIKGQTTPGALSIACESQAVHISS